MAVYDQHDLTARVNVTGGLLDVKSATVTMDEAWSPYVQATLTCAAPAGSVLERIDPRKQTLRGQVVLHRRFGGSDPASVLSTAWAGKRARDVTTLLAGKRARDVTADHFYPWNDFGVRASQYRAFNLSVRSRQRGHKDGEIVLALASDEALLQDYGLVDITPYAPSLSSIRTVVGSVLTRIGRALAPGTADGVIDPAASKWMPGVKAWDYLAPIVQSAQLRLWCDENGIFHLSTATEVQPGNLVLSQGGSIVDATDTIDRDGDDWYDSVVIVYQWTDAAGVTQTAYDIASTPGYSKTLTLTYEQPYPGPGAAQGVLNRALGRGRSLGPTVVSDYTATPGQPVVVNLDDTPTQTGYLSSVAWSWPQAEMEAKTRGLIDTPATAYMFGPDGLSYNAVPAGISYNTFDWTAL